MSIKNAMCGKRVKKENHDNHKYVIRWILAPLPQKNKNIFIAPHH